MPPLPSDPELAEAATRAGGGVVCLRLTPEEERVRDSLLADYAAAEAALAGAEILAKALPDLRAAAAVPGSPLAYPEVDAGLAASGARYVLAVDPTSQEVVLERRDTLTLERGVDAGRTLESLLQQPAAAAAAPAVDAAAGPLSQQPRLPAGPTAALTAAGFGSALAEAGYSSATGSSSSDAGAAAAAGGAPPARLLGAVAAPPRRSSEASIKSGLSLNASAEDILRSFGAGGGVDEKGDAVDDDADVWSPADMRDMLTSTDRVVDAFGLPDSPQMRSVAGAVVRAFREDADGRVAPVHAASVDAILDRLRAVARNADSAKGAIARETYDAMQRQPGAALRAAHAVIVEVGCPSSPLCWHARLSPPASFPAATAAGLCAEPRRLHARRVPRADAAHGGGRRRRLCGRL